MTHLKNLSHSKAWLIDHLTGEAEIEYIKFHGSEAWGNKTKEMYYSLLSHKMIPFVLFPQASEPSMNFNISKMVCRKRLNVKL